MVEYNSYMNSPEWDAVRRDVLDRAKGRCERCGERARLEMHHKHYDSLGSEELDDLEALCADCHSDADLERESKTGTSLPPNLHDDAEEERMDRRFRAWADTVYGRGWEMHEDERDLRERFERFLEERD